MTKKLNVFTMPYAKAKEYKAKEKLESKRGLYERACKSIFRTDITSFDDTPTRRLSVLRPYLQSLYDLQTRLKAEFGPGGSSELRKLDYEITDVKEEICEVEMLAIKPGNKDNQPKPAWRPGKP